MDDAQSDGRELPSPDITVVRRGRRGSETRSSICRQQGGPRGTMLKHCTKPDMDCLLLQGPRDVAGTIDEKSIRIKLLRSCKLSSREKLCMLSTRFSKLDSIIPVVEVNHRKSKSKLPINLDPKQLQCFIGGRKLWQTSTRWQQEDKDRSGADRKTNMHICLLGGAKTRSCYQDERTYKLHCLCQ